MFVWQMIIMNMQKKINVANVGDSRAVLVRNGTPIDLSTEHRVYGKGEVARREIDRIHSAGGWVQDGNNSFPPPPFDYLSVPLSN